MILRGILDRSLSNQLCIRGFANIKELARISKANPDYQRELIDKQKNVISNFLTEETYLFFPEVILSLKLNYDFTLPKAKTELPLTLIESNKIFKSNMDNLTINVIQQKNNKVFDSSGRDIIRVAEIKFDTAKLEQQIFQKEHPLHRIDGNHRLSAAEQVTNNDRITNMDIPFCIILFEKTITNEFDPQKNKFVEVTKNDFEKFERVVFYNINSKSTPLTLEQNLKSILGEQLYFEDIEISKIFSSEGKDVGLYSRKLGLKIDSQNFQSIQGILEKNKWAICISIFRLYKLFIKKKFTDDLIEVLYQSIQSISTLYAENDLLKSNKSTDIFISLLYFKAFTSIETYKIFCSWLLNNHIFQLLDKPIFEQSNSNAGNIIQIFNKLYSKEIKVFVAMPYFSKEIVNSHNEIYKGIVKEIKETYGINITLHEIMNHTGATINIPEDILTKIRNCQIFISNITGNNPNVTYEMGYAKALNIPIIIIKEVTAEEPKSDYKLDYYATYQSDAHMTIRDEVLKHIRTVLKINYKFNLKK